jgi:hypothetical protein
MAPVEPRPERADRVPHMQKFDGGAPMIPLATIIILVALFLAGLAWLWR